MQPSTDRTIAPQHATGQLSPHVAGFFERVDVWLAKLPQDSDRIDFLSRRLVEWTGRYERWALKVDMGEATDPKVTAWDFTDTISGIDRRLSELRARQ